MTLFNQVKDIEEINKKLRSYDKSILIDVASLQKKIFQKYECNPVLSDAINKYQSIEESLQELGQVNKGIKKILPWTKNKVHNERLKQIGELVWEPKHLYTKGILAPDNFVTVGTATTLLTFGACNIFSNLLLPELYVNSSPEFLTLQANLFSTLIPVAAFLVPMFGISINSKRFNSLPTYQAKFLDEKIQEFYK